MTIHDSLASTPTVHLLHILWFGRVFHKPHGRSQAFRLRHQPPPPHHPFDYSTFEPDGRRLFVCTYGIASHTYGVE